MKDLHCLKLTKTEVTDCTSDPLRTLYDSIFAATTAAASVCVCLARGLFGRLPVFTFTVKLAVVITLALCLAVGLTVSLQPVLKLTDVLINTSGGICHPCSAHVFIITGVLLTLLLGNVHVVLPACPLGIRDICDG